MAPKHLVFVTLLVLVLAVSAMPVRADFDVSYEILDDAIYPDEVATFEVTLFNNEEEADAYTVYSIDPNWILETVPVSIKAAEDSSVTFTLRAQPKRSLATGPHLLPVRFKSIETEKVEEISLFIYLKSYTQVDPEYLPSVELIVRVPSEIDPREPLAVEVMMQNRNALNIQALDVVLSSELFEKEYTTTLGPLEDKTTELLFDVDPLTPAGTYPLTVQLRRWNDTVSEAKKNIRVEDYSRIVEESYTVNELFKSTEYITVKNIGNERKEGLVERQRNWFQRLFTKTDPPIKAEEFVGETVYLWKVNLNAQGKTQIVIVENYRFLVSIIITIILIIVGYYLFRSPIVTLKKAKFFGSKEEGSSYVKIKVFMKNRTKKPVFNIKVIDKVPKMAKVLDDADVLGTVKPTKVVRHPRAGTIVRWGIEKLDPYEERIITYKIRSHLKIVGSMKLDPVKIKFDTGLGKERATYSNAVSIDTEVVRRPVSPDRERLRRRPSR